MNKVRYVDLLNLLYAFKREGEDENFKEYYENMKEHHCSEESHKYILSFGSLYDVASILDLSSMESLMENNLQDPEWVKRQI